MEIKASEFKAKCLQLMDQVAASGDQIVITKNGVPVARLVPFRERPASLFRLHADTMALRDDLIDPTGVEWEAER